MRAANVPVVPFRGSGGVADEEAAAQQLAPRPAIARAEQAVTEAGIVVDRVCAIVVGPQRARAFALLRDELAHRAPDLASRLGLGLDGRVALVGSTEPLDAAGFELALAAWTVSAAWRLARPADAVGVAVLAMALELLARLQRWGDAADLASAPDLASSQRIAAVEAAGAMLDGEARFQLWRHVASVTGDPLATLSAIEAAAALGARDAMCAALDGLAELLETRAPELPQHLLGVVESERDAEVAIRLARRLADAARWLGDPFQELRAVRRWLSRAPDDERAIRALIGAASRAAPVDGVRVLLESVDLVDPDHRIALLRAARDLAQAHAHALSEDDRVAILRRPHEIAPSSAQFTAMLRVVVSAVDSPAAEHRLLDELATRYDRLREDPPSAGRTVLLDELVQQMVEAARVRAGRSGDRGARSPGRGDAQPHRAGHLSAAGVRAGDGVPAARMARPPGAR